jgi:hypothetical protein
MFSSIVTVIVIVMLLGSLPIWTYSRSWGYSRSKWCGLATGILFTLFLMGWI